MGDGAATAIHEREPWRWLVAWCPGTVVRPEGLRFDISFTTPETILELLKQCLNSMDSEV
jgi:hypothetical protein